MQGALQNAAMRRQDEAQWTQLDGEVAGYVVNGVVVPFREGEARARARESVVSLLARAANARDRVAVETANMREYTATVYHPPPEVVLRPVPAEDLPRSLRDGPTASTSAPTSEWEGWERFRMPL